MASRIRSGRVPLAVTLILVAAGIPAAALVAPSTATEVSARTGDKTSSRPDAVSAMLAARVQDSRVEDLSARTPTTASFANANGTWTTEAYAGVVRSKVDVDTWVPIDPSVEKRSESYAPAATPFDTQFSNGGDKTVGEVTSNDGLGVKVGWPTNLPAPTTDGAELTYPDAAGPGADLLVESRSDGFSYSVILEKAPAPDAAPLTYRVPVTLDGLEASVKSDGSIVLKDGKDRVGVMTAPVMWDKANAVEGGERHAVGTTVEVDGDRLVVVLTPSMDFLRDPATTYPVTVDPAFSMNAAGDTWVESLGATGSQFNSAELRVGSTSLGVTKARTYLSFDLAPLGGMSGSATSAQLSMTNFQTGACAGSAIQMSRVTGTLSIPTITWSSQPTTTATGATTSSVSSGAGACPGEALATWDATQVVNDALGAGSTLGLQIKAVSESATAGYRKYRSLENGTLIKVPQLTVTYNKVPSTPTESSVAPGNPGYATSLTPTLSTVASDPDGGLVRGYFEIYSGATRIWYGSSAWAPSGSRVTATVPSGILSNGSTYSVRSYSQDDLVKSSAYQSQSLAVDTTAPTTTITATPFAANTWTAPAPGSSSFTINGSADTATFEAVINGVPKSLVPNIGNGDYTYSGVTPIAEWSVWEAAAIDNAGNRGPTASFSFGSGAPGFTLPRQNAVSTAVFPLDISAPPGATGATLQWKLKGEATFRDALHVTKGAAAWDGSVLASTGRSETGPLLWNATAETYGSGTLAAPAVVMLWACFQYPSSADKCSFLRTVQLVPSAFGGNFPVGDLGPASVALHTGEASIDDLDAADSKAGISRTFTSFDASTLGIGVFGRGWGEDSVFTSPSAHTRAQVIDNRTKDGSIVIVYPDTGSQTFVPVGSSTTAFSPLQPTGDATALTFIPAAGGNPDRLRLDRPVGAANVQTTWNLNGSDTGSGPGWVVSEVDGPGGTSDVTITNDHQRPVWIRESDPSASASCTATAQAVGCRGLEVTYVGSGSATRVASVVRVVGASTPSAVRRTTLATYTYDVTGDLLTKVCSPAPATGQPALCTAYTYTTVGSRTLIATTTPPGQAPWRFSYDSIGRLASVKRERPSSGDATWSVDYGLATNASGLPDLTPSAVAQWGQLVAPTKVFAVYGPSSAAPDVSQAQLFYTANDGTVTNTATYGPSGWLVSTRWLNANGDEVQHLDGLGWRRVLAAPSGDRLRVAGEASSFTVFNTWGDAETIGTRVVDSYGPAHTATLKNGTTGLFRTHSSTVYDDDPNVDPALIADRSSSDGLGLVVKEIASTSNATRTVDYDSTVTEYGYGPVVAGDGDGWVLGSPTKESTRVGGVVLETRITRSDVSGRVVEVRLPGGASDSSGAGTDARSTVTSYYTAGGSGDCGGRPEWDGLVCKVGPAVQPSDPKIPTEFTTAYDENFKPLVTQELSGTSLTRTTTTSYDKLGRAVSRSVATTGSNVLNETLVTTMVWDDELGLPISKTLGAFTETIEYDDWGRQSAYVDALGTTSATTYDAAGRVETFNDGTATYTYDYDSHGTLTDVDAGGGVGTFSYAYAPNGLVESITYPNGVAAEWSYDEVGSKTGLTYAQGATDLIGFSATLAADGTTTGRTSSDSAQKFTFDGLRRLTKVEDETGNGCTTRLYSFDTASNRSGFTSYNPASTTLQCQATSASSTWTGVFDAAGRNRNAGYVYDTLGRTLVTPLGDTGPGAASNMTATYHANNMVASVAQDVTNGGGIDSTVKTFELDPTERINRITASEGGTEVRRSRYRFSSESDSPASIDTSVDGGSTWQSTRYVTATDLGMVATTTGGQSTIQLANLQGNIVASMSNTSGTLLLDRYEEGDEYGRTSEPTTQTYGWLGTAQRSTDSLGGTMLMGARVYNPATGSFLSSDPARSGNVTAYTYPQDPINQSDPSGEAAVDGTCQPGYNFTSYKTYGDGYNRAGQRMFRITWKKSWCYRYASHTISSWYAPVPLVTIYAYFPTFWSVQGVVDDYFAYSSRDEHWHAHPGYPRWSHISWHKIQMNVCLGFKVGCLARFYKVGIISYSDGSKNRIDH